MDISFLLDTRKQYAALRTHAIEFMNKIIVSPAFNQRGGFRVFEKCRRSSTFRIHVKGYAMTATINRHYGAKSWIEGAAERQLDEVAALDGMETVSAFPDLHPGKNGPVGMVASASRLYPHLVGNDLGCGFSLFDLGIPVRKLRADKAEERLRAAVFEPPEDVADRLEGVGLPPALYGSHLGSIGGGNHFAELTCVDEVMGSAAPSNDSVLLLVHTGSRALGTHVWDDVAARARNIHAGLDPRSELGLEWFARQIECAAWASLNRRLVAETVASALRGDCVLVCDVAHNLVVSDVEEGGNVVYRHYKGASRVTEGELAPVAGSRDTVSHLVTAAKVSDSGFGIAHGSGRKRDRASMHPRNGLKRSEREALQRNPFGGRIICDDSSLLLEEQGSAYKNPRQVIDDLVAAGLVAPACSLRPIVTYKKASETDPSTLRRAEARGHRGDRHGRR
jgi:release factor H-coupled RctB family protein